VKLMFYYAKLLLAGQEVRRGCLDEQAGKDFTFREYFDKQLLGTVEAFMDEQLPMEWIHQIPTNNDYYIYAATLKYWTIFTYKHLLRWRSYSDDNIVALSPYLVDMLYMEKKDFVKDFLLPSYDEYDFAIKPGTEVLRAIMDVEFLGAKFEVIGFDGVTPRNPVMGYPKYNLSKMMASAMRPTSKPVFKKPKRKNFQSEHEHSEAMKVYNMSLNTWVKARLIGLSLLAYYDIDAYNFLKYCHEIVKGENAEITKDQLVEAIRDVIPDTYAQAYDNFAEIFEGVAHFPTPQVLWRIYTEAPIPVEFYAVEATSAPWGDRVEASEFVAGLRQSIEDELESYAI
jgi:hypothetical protein